MYVGTQTPGQQANGTGRFFDRDELWDVLVTFNGMQLKCHKVILSQASPFLDNICGPDSMKTEPSNSIKLPDHEDPDVRYAMMSYIYDFGYIERFAHRKDETQFHLNILMAAKTYGIQKLEAEALQRFEQACSKLASADAVLSVCQQHADLLKQSKRLDEIMTKLKEKHLLQLLLRPEFGQFIGKDFELMQKIERKLSFVESLEVSQLNKGRVTYCSDDLWEKYKNRATMIKVWF